MDSYLLLILSIVALIAIVILAMIFQRAKTKQTQADSSLKNPSDIES